jgi:hypothetical protein
MTDDGLLFRRRGHKRANAIRLWLSIAASGLARGDP